MKNARWSVVALTVGLLLLSGLGCGGSGPTGAGTSNDTQPSVTDDVGGDLTVVATEVATFTLTVSDAEFDKVDIRLLNPQPGMSVAPMLGRITPVVLRVRWLVPINIGADLPLLFAVNETLDPTVRVVHRVQARYTAEEGMVANDSMFRGDVTGDGIPDVVAGATGATVGGFATAGALYVWQGGGTLSPTPLATLTLPNPAVGDWLGGVNGRNERGLQLGDVTGDGILDVVALSTERDVGNADTGAVYVWKGGATLTGTPSFTAELVDPGAAAGSLLGQAGGGHVMFLHDVTGDGVADVLVASGGADAIFVWKGGALLAGSALAPLAKLTDPPNPGVGLGITNYQSMALGDVTGDGIDDIVTASPSATGLQFGSGMAWVWQGGAALTGTPAPLARLMDPNAAIADGMGAGSGVGVQLGDVTGDGIFDVVVANPGGDPLGVPDAGQVLVWAGGGGLPGSPVPTTLRRAVPQANDRVGMQANAFHDQGVQLADVTGDGVLDVVASAPGALVTFVRQGMILVWKGGGTLSSVPLAELSDPTAFTALDQLGSAGEWGVQMGDVTGDGVLDVVAGSAVKQVGANPVAGSVFVWQGGPTIASAPVATLRDPAAPANSSLGGFGAAIQLADLTGDDVLDVAARTGSAPGAPANSGAVYVWEGGAALLAGGGFPGIRATLMAPVPLVGDAIANDTPRGLILADVTGDDLPDVLAASPLADVASVVDAGAVFVWRGGAPLTGSPAAVVLSATTGAVAGDKLSFATLSLGVLVRDVTGDGTPDVVAGAAGADATAVDSGAVFVWTGGPGIAPAPLVRLAVTGAVAGDALGYGAGTGGQQIQIGDVTGDGVPDIFVCASRAQVGLVVGAGAIYVWPGSPSIPAAPTARFAATSPQFNDQLGN